MVDRSPGPAYGREDLTRTMARNVLESLLDSGPAGASALVMQPRGRTELKEVSPQVNPERGGPAL